MKHIKVFFTVLLMSVLAVPAFAQLSPVDFMRNNPRSTFANVATYTVDDGYFDFFLGGINFGLMNTGFKYDKFFRFNENGQPTTLLLNEGIASMKDVNYLNTYLNFDIFSCGRRTKHGYFTYTHRLREMQSLSYNKDLFQLLAQGNGQYIDENRAAELSLGLSARAFQEFDLGFQMSLLEQLNIGMRLKFLMGAFDVKTNAFGASLSTDANSYALSLKASAEAMGSLPYQLSIKDGKIGLKDSRFNIGNMFKNYGWGVDMGAEYQINEHWGVAAAINDLGKIKWNTFTYKFSAGLNESSTMVDDGALVFEGLTAEQVEALMNDPDFMGGMIDTLKNVYKVSIEELASYSTGINTNMMVRGYFDLTPSHRFSAQLTGYNMGLGMKPAMTLAYTGTFGKKYDVVATYTMMKGSFDNIGIGLSANFGGILLYVATNNFLGFFNPANRTQLNAQFGISLTSGKFANRSNNVIIKIEAEEAEAEAESEEKESEGEVEEDVKEPVKETEPEKVTEPVKVPAPEKVTDTVKAAEPEKVIDSVKPVEPEKVIDSVKPIEPEKILVPDQVTDTVNVVEPEKVTDSVKVVVPVKLPVPERVIDTVKLAEPEKVTDSMKVAEPVKVPDPEKE